MSVTFSLLLFLHVFFGAGNPPDKIRTAWLPNIGSESRETRANESDKQPAKDSGGITSQVTTMRSEYTQESQTQKTDEMRRSDVEIQESIRDDTRRMANAAWWQFGASTLGIIFVVLTLRINSKSSTAAIESVKKMEQVADEANRPWISVDCKIDGKFLPTVAPGEIGFVINLVCEIENHGRSPATNVIWRAKMGTRYSVKQNLSVRDALCEEMKKFPEQEAQTIFPR